jgi:hypothetical protein
MFSVGAARRAVFPSIVRVPRGVGATPRSAQDALAHVCARNAEGTPAASEPDQIQPGRSCPIPGHWIPNEPEPNTHSIDLSGIAIRTNPSRTRIRSDLSGIAIRTNPSRSPIVESEHLESERTRGGPEPS